MNADQEAHLARLKREFGDLLEAKYRHGAEEHAQEYGGELLRVPLLKLLDHAIEEAIDQVAYLLSLKEKLTGVAG
jgi:hypothetical protein